MIISFIGCPCSGKTTTAALVFAELKKSGTAAEFITEQARLYIANKRSLSSNPNPTITLNDGDQQNIMHQQYNVEVVMENPDTIVVTDSCPLNSILYMTPEFASGDTWVKDIAKNTLEMDRMIFYCPPVPNPGSDPNRVHNQEESDKLDKAIPDMLRKFAPGVKIIQLSGDSEARAAQVIFEISKKRLGL